MCIIAMKIKGAGWPYVENIKACMDRNSHGFAFAWTADGKIQVMKTMDAKEALDFYRNVLMKMDPAETAMMFHARLATHGSRRVENCHCFLNESETLVFSHNGILHNVPNRDDMTDSETFFRDYFLPVAENCGLETAKKIMSAICGDHNKFAFMGTDGKMLLWPQTSWIVDKESTSKGVIYYSNTTFRVQKNIYAYQVLPPMVKHPKEAKSTKELKKAKKTTGSEVQGFGSRFLFDRD